MWGGMDHGFGWGGMGFMGTVLMVLFWVLVFLGIVVLVKWFVPSSGTSNRLPEKSALDILKERYARGEIERDEFEQKKRDLEG